MQFEGGAKKELTTLSPGALPGAAPSYVAKPPAPEPAYQKVEIQDPEGRMAPEFKAGVGTLKELYSDIEAQRASMRAESPPPTNWTMVDRLKHHMLALPADERAAITKAVDAVYGYEPQESWRAEVFRQDPTFSHILDEMIMWLDVGGLLPPEPEPKQEAPPAPTGYQRLEIYDPKGRMASAFKEGVYKVEELHFKLEAERARLNAQHAPLTSRGMQRALTDFVNALPVNERTAFENATATVFKSDDNESLNMLSLMDSKFSQRLGEVSMTLILAKQER